MSDRMLDGIGRVIGAAIWGLLVVLFPFAAILAALATVLFLPFAFIWSVLSVGRH